MIYFCAMCSFLENPGDCVRFLGREIVKREGGYDLAVNRQLAQDIVDDAGTIGRRTFGAPGAKDSKKDITPLTPRDHSYYRTQVGRLLFYCQYRADMQYSVSQLSRHVGAPTQWNLLALKRLVRYLAVTMDMVLEMRPRKSGPRTLRTASDADWAGLDDRKSVSSACVFFCESLIMSYSRVQATPALSSCESELYALGSAASESLWVAGVIQEAFQLDVIPIIEGDSSSALALASRSGVGRLRHIEIPLLAIQEWTQRKRLMLKKIPTATNVSDIGTKFLTAARTAELADMLGIRFPGSPTSGRGVSASIPAE
jgi:hypothetical protein